MIELSFQLTTSQGGRQYKQLCYAHLSYFNSRPHKEVDRRRGKRCHRQGISTHDLTRRSTANKIAKVTGTFIFQLTTSQGGRQADNVQAYPHKYFNSRPHKEVDGRRYVRKMKQRYFNSRPHKEVDIFWRLGLLV